MTQLPTDPRPGGPSPGVTPARVIAWIVVGGIGVYLLVSGILGILAKG